ncbi:MAG: glycerate kinase [Tissierellia bacterium]|nr:glycerate kinase [Tissierellia bacterium]
MNIIVAIESFLNIINSAEIGDYIKKGLPDDRVKILPVIDGGRGSVDVIKKIIGGNFQYVNVHDPLNHAVTCRYILKGELAIIEMAETSGLHLIYEKDRDIMKSSSIGLGECIVDALDNGAREFTITIGDTATNDMGMGMLYALGAKFLDENKRELEPSVINLRKVVDMDINGLDNRLKESKFYLACNINSPLLGENGAALKHARKKGAKEADILKLENLAKDFTALVKRKFDIHVENHPQAGAGGGCSYAMMAFLNANAKRTMDLIIDNINFKDHMKDSNLVFVGEELTDWQNSPSLRIAKIAKEAKKDLKVVFLGDDLDVNIKKPKEIDAIFNMNYYHRDKKLSEKEYYGINIQKTAKEIRDLII